MINRPDYSEFDSYYQHYVDLVPKTTDIFTEAFNQHMDSVDLLTSLDDETLSGTYAPDKWTILQILNHLVDCERIFCYRALMIARGFDKELPGFDHNSFVKNSSANSRKILDIIREYSSLRASTIELFRSFSADMLNSTGITSGKKISVGSILFVIIGHEIHHRNIIEEKYIGKF